MVRERERDKDRKRDGYLFIYDVMYVYLSYLTMFSLVQTCSVLTGSADPAGLRRQARGSLGRAGRRPADGPGTAQLLRAEAQATLSQVRIGAEIHWPGLVCAK